MFKNIKFYANEDDEGNEKYISTKNYFILILATITISAIMKYD